MLRFLTAAHLASWAGAYPGNNESVGKRISSKTRKGNPSKPSAVIVVENPVSLLIKPIISAILM